VQQTIYKLKMVKCNWNVVKSNNNQNVWEWKKTRFLLVITTMMQVKKNIFNNWMEHHMCGDYCSMNKWTCLHKYSMPLLKEIFDALG
jgi:hypothetical protein